MKWLKYAAAAAFSLALIVLLILVGLGGLRGESRLVHTIQIDRPASDVFTWITEPERLKAWVGSLVDVETLTPGSQGPGTRTRWMLHDAEESDQVLEVDFEVTRVEPGRLLEARVHSPELSGSVSYNLEPLDANRTLLMYRANSLYERKLLVSIYSRAAQRKLNDDMARLKQLAEARPLGR